MARKKIAEEFDTRAEDRERVHKLARRDRIADMAEKETNPIRKRELDQLVAKFTAELGE